LFGQPKQERYGVFVLVQYLVRNDGCDSGLQTLDEYLGFPFVNGNGSLCIAVCDVLVMNKIDVLPYFDFDMDKVRKYAHMRNPKLKIIPINAKTGEGVNQWCGWLREQVSAWNEK
jgi:hypothetical protein